MKRRILETFTGMYYLLVLLNEVSAFRSHYCYLFVSMRENAIAYI